MNKILPYLSYAGAIPFFLCTICLIFNITQLPLLGHVEEILSVYGLIILSFLAGSYWGQNLIINKTFLPIISNIIAIFLWLGFLVLSFEMLMAMFVISFIFLLIIDYRIFRMNLINFNYFQTRFFVSIIVIISLIISGIIS